MRILFLYFVLLQSSIFLFAQDISHPFPNSQFIKVNDLQIHYRTWKPQQAEIKGKILLIHGFCGSTFSWRKNVPALVDAGFQVWAVDVPPFGYSDRTLSVNHSPSFQAQLLWDWISMIEKDYSSWYLIGHSLGGGIAGAMAVRKPEKTAGLVIMDGLLFSTNNKGKGWRKWILGSRKIQKYVELAGKFYFFRFRKMQKLLGDAYGQTPDSSAVWGYLTPLQIKNTASGILDMLAYAEPVFYVSESEINLQTLIIWGKNDRWIPLERGKTLHKLLPKSELKIIEGGGHCPNETHVGEFNELLLSYLKN